MRRRPLSVMALVVLSAPLGAQCRVARGSNEARLLAYYAVPLVFSPAGELGGLSSGGVRAGLELTYIPTPNPALQHTSSCFRPKQENSDISPVLPRPRVSVGLPGGFFIEATYLPPVTVADATPNLFGLAAGVVRPLRGRFSVALRLHGVIGSVEGPITCPAAALQTTDITEPCFGETPSKDRYHPNAVGLETAVMWASSGRGAAYAGVGVTSLRPRFQVGFQQANGFFDATRVSVDLTRAAAFLGASYSLSRRLHLAGELYSVPKDLTTVRVGGTLLVR